MKKYFLLIMFIVAAAISAAAAEVSDIAAFFAAKNTAETTTITGPVTVVYKRGAYMFLEDKSGALVVKGKVDRKFKRGDVLEGVTGVYESAGGVAGMVSPVADSLKVVGNVKAPKPKKLSISKITKRMHGRYVTVKDVVIKAGKKENFYSISDEAGLKLGMLNRFQLKDVPVGKECDVAGFVMVSPKGNIVLNATRIALADE